MNLNRSLPRYSIAQLEEKALTVIQHYHPESTKNQYAVPVEAFIASLQTSGHIEYAIGNLGTIGNSKILGLFITKPRNAIYIDHSLVGTIRFRFTLAHELGHFVLHRKIDVGGNITDTSDDLLETPAQAQTDRQWAEWQANNFAASLLLPRQSLGTFIFNNAENFGLKLGEGTLQPAANTFERAALERFTEFGASRFDVSKTTFRLRMMRLGIIE